ncbi:MAG: SPOR domain-containing protein [Pseudomonadota bacterium]
MPRDYAKRYNQNHSQKGASKKRKKGASGSSIRGIFVIIVILLVIASGVAGYFYYHQPKIPTSLLPPVVDAKATSPKKAVNKAPVVEAKEEPVDYEFYTLLPKINVPDPASSTAPPDEQPGYWLQLMLYYNMRDASAYLDKLQLMGLDVAITQRKSTKTDHDLFVIVLGPFTTKENAVARQQELKKMNISSYIFHVDPPIANATPDQAETEAVAAAASAPSDVPVVDATPDTAVG